MKKIWIICGLSVSCLTVPVLASMQFSSPLGSNGIDVLKLHQPPYNLTGRKIAIGQVEIGRPGMFGLDKTVSKNRAISPMAVFSGTIKATSNSGVDPHAYNVAAVMISQDKAWTGVAPNARLYSSAIGSTKNMGQQEECLSAQHIALQNGGDVRAINFSFGEPLNRDPRPDAVLDGQALLTLCIDWSSRVHNVVYAIAGNQGKGGIPIPTDNFNGINVAFSSPREGIFNKVHVSNLAGNNQGVGDRLAGKEFNLGGRRSVSIIAPGTNIPVLNPDGKLNKVTGSSFAAPHLTATIALLQEFADRQLKIKQQNWTTAARNHQVMKAVLLNSAEKIQDNGNGLSLGMTKNLIDKQNRNWFASDAYKSPQIPLDPQMGTGHLNAYRAYQQFMFGQWQPKTKIPPIGWDYNQINVNSTLEYSLEKPLQQNSFVAITLTWDRLVKLNDKNQNQQYDIDESFQDQGLNNLDLYLIKEDGLKTETATCASVSKIDNIEHIFCPVPITGKYKIRVQFQQQVNQPTQPYSLAWWTVPVN
ncbi:S8 family serine peptidase [Okeanomitos corallinicola TIOX110]|uniref:S8 family serine peptidase n=1 Tax=Okeanomitos corallinicola TIOX110 TaxID=3133117 RepID=A0ABZ2UW92_9CYAN